MLKRVIKPQIIKRFCHHSTETKFGRILDILDSIQSKGHFTAEKVKKLETDIVLCHSLIFYNYLFTVIIIPSSILLTK
jgi:hypothetical protein